MSKHKPPTPTKPKRHAALLKPIVLLPLLFTLGTIILLPWLTGDLLHTASSFSLFMMGSQFWNDCFHSAAGALQWLGCAGTSLCYYPWLGGSVLLLIWLATWWVLRRVFPLPHRWQWLHFLPLIALLASVLDLGYWIYYLKQSGYLFRHSIGLLAVALLLHWRHRHWGWVMSFVTLCFYPLLGWYSVLALLLRLLRCLFYRQWSNGIIAAIAALAGPPALSLLYTNQRNDEAWTVGFPELANNLSSSTLLVAPHYVAILALASMLFLSWRFRPSATANEPVQPTTNSRLLNTLLMLLMLGSAYLCRPNDYNLYSEMRIIRQLEEGRFADVLKEVDEAPDGPTRQMIVAKNVALVHTGHVSDLMYEFPNAGPDPIATDGLEIHLAQTAGPLYYLLHGMANNATHWCIENSVEIGLNLFSLRILSQAALLSGESDLAYKYLGMLGLSPFQQSFAARYMPLAMHPEWMSEYPELSLMKELHDDLIPDTYGDDSNIEWCIYQAFSDQLVHPSVKASELALAYAMMRKDADLFWTQLYSYSQTLKQKMPLKFQEAALFFASMPDAKYPVTNFRFDPQVVQSFQVFSQRVNGLSQNHVPNKEIGQRVKPQFGNTYWWFYHFCVNVQVY